jgi:hypothetical protein
MGQRLRSLADRAARVAINMALLTELFAESAAPVRHVTDAYRRGRDVPAACHVGTTSVPGWHSARESPGHSTRTPQFPSRSKPPQGHPKATTKPSTVEYRATPRLPQGHPKATPRPPQGYPKATPRLPQGHPKATPRPPQGYPKATPRLHQSQPQRPLFN